MSAPTSRLAGISRIEFIALMAGLVAINALAIDIMLPGMQEIGEALGEPDENRRQLIVTAYFAGFGVMQLFVGPLSDRFGRKMPLMLGVGVYIAAAVGSLFVTAFNTLLVLRVIMGAGAAGSRVLTVAMARDVAGGRQMAEIMSLVMMVFMIMPIIAPAMGQTLLLIGDWRLIFAFIAVVGLGIGLWAQIRLPETLKPENRLPFTASAFGQGFAAVVTNRLSLWYTLAGTFIFSALFGFINSAQQIYVGIYGLGVWFPLAFAAVAALISLSSWMNSRLVQRLGMRRVSHAALFAFIASSTVMFGLASLGPVPFLAFYGLFAVIMFCFGLIGSNFSAIAMEPLGHVAGMASSIQGFVQTVFSAVAGAIIGQAFDGTIMPIAAGFLAVSLSALACVLIAEKGRIMNSGLAAPHP